MNKKKLYYRANDLFILINQMAYYDTDINNIVPIIHVLHYVGRIDVNENNSFKIDLTEHLDKSLFEIDIVVTDYQLNEYFVPFNLNPINEEYFNVIQKNFEKVLNEK